MIKEFLKRATF